MGLGGWDVCQVPIIFPRPGQVAQLVEQGTENPRVGGSIPSLAIAQGPVSSGLSSFVNFGINPCVRPGIIELIDPERSHGTGITFLWRTLRRASGSGENKGLCLQQQHLLVEGTDGGTCDGNGLGIHRLMRGL